MKRIINKHDVFISWTGADRELKNTVADFLRNNGISCLESDHSCSGDFRQWSQEAVSRCNIFLLIGSVDVFNSEWVPVEIEEYKKLDNSKNRIIPVWVSRDAWEREPWGIKEYASAVMLNEDGLTEDALKDVLSKVKLLLIDFLDREYKEASKSEYIKLISLSRKSKTVDRDFVFSTLYINRTLCETDDKGTELKKYSSTDFLYESDSVCFICGPAGCGKSQYTNQIRENAPKDTVIIRLPCSGVSSAADVFSEAYKEFSRVCGNRFFYSEDDFASLLNSRKVVLILDGMDEIATVEDKRRLIAKAEEFCKANKGNVILTFTSRNLADAALIAIDGKNVRRFRLKNLSENETNKLVSNLFICFKKEDKADDFFVKAKDLDDEIRSNPLLISQLAIIYDSNKGEIPKTLVEIYDTITEITLKLDKNADKVIPEDYKAMITRDISEILKSFAKTKYTLASKGRNFDTERILNIVLEAMNYKGDLQQMSEFLVDYLENRALFVDGEFYHKMFLEYFTAVSYYDAAFDAANTIENEAVLRELFSHYDDPYWSAVIKMLLIKADSTADRISTKELYEFISQLGICEYTLLFDTCRDLIRFKEEAQTVLAADIIRKSADGGYPAYGPLFWYVPEYGLYKACLTALRSLKNEAGFAKMLALVRDVCFIFSGKYTAEAFTDKSACIELFNAAKGKLSGVRKALCELFYLGNTDFTGGDDIYPRCFNVSEAASFMENGCGVIGRMSTPFEDELEFFEHTAYNELCGEFIGIVSCPYVIDEIENVLTKKSCRKLSCLILSPSDNTEMQYIAINQNHVRAVYIPENVETMRNKAIHISFSITILSEGLFYFSSDFTLPNGVTKILKEEFSGYSSIKSVVLSKDVTEICEHAFICCFNLEKIYISKSVTRIAEGAFWGTKLTSINIPNSITSIAKDAFWGSSKLTRFSVDTDNLYYSSDACGVLFDKAKSTLLQYPDNKAKKYSLPDSVTHISDSAFSHCENLTDIIIPNSVISIGDKAFLGCTSLTNIAIPNSVTSIGAEAFSGCTSLTNIAIPNSVTSIGVEAFSGCTSLTNITIPDSVTSIGKWAFSYCENLTDIIIPNSVTSVGDKAFENCTKLSRVIINSFVNIEANIFEGCCNLKDIVTPNGVVNIVKAGTLGNKLLSNITIPNNITAIDSDTFKSYTKIKSIIIPDSIATIADYTFQTCNNLTNIVVDVNNPYYSSDEYGVLFNKDKTKLIQYPIGNPRECYTIPDGVTHISACAFKHCENLTNISIPNSVTTIGGFDSCAILQVPNRFVIKGIDVFSHCKKLVSINIPDSVIYISAFSFDGCTNLKSVKISNSVKRIDACTFRQCTNLKKIIIPNIVTDIRKNAFENCCSLEEIEIPSSVRIIGNDAFNGCTGLTRVVISRRFEDDIERIFGNINRNIITFAD